MFKFLFGSKAAAPEVKRETQRETVLRAQAEINEILATLSPKPRITIYPEEGSFTIDLPEQMPDEAKALPAPDLQPGSQGSTPTA
ncbi:MAG: hypothetical protein HLUCCA05_12945 [Roseibaca calidilacus]|uniref:Uncharacterized protein n=1 Tax=Roseibaca calidilacus TaxID=1666912 RepID=A0A0P8AIK9_9RHOB|nr:hypothetical protein [Roseibaca calidilacus]KPP94220.1 MAG: hypothetical protein HLUCCA05_12945 [Roseibaca calidilacus]CUX81353.1 hypothetical protein Ga0058931_1710 [Roseibaca calidilacus]